MKDFRCMIEIHDWTQWRRPAMRFAEVNIGGEIDPTNILSAAPLQHRRCKRCGKAQSRPFGHVPPRPFPSSRKQPPGVE